MSSRVVGASVDDAAYLAGLAVLDVAVGELLLAPRAGASPPRAVPAVRPVLREVLKF